MVERIRIHQTPRRIRISDPTPVDNLPTVTVERIQRFGEAGPGRPRGSRNLLPQQVAKYVLQAMDELGNDGVGSQGIVGFVKSVFEKFPAGALPLLHKMVPHVIEASVTEESSVTHQHDHVHRVDPEQLSRLSTDELARLYGEAVRAPVGGVAQSRRATH